MNLAATVGWRIPHEAPVPTDPYWGDVVLHLNAETTVAHDSSVINRTLTNGGALSVTGGGQLEGTASLDLSGGTLTTTGDGYYAALMSSNEWTFRGWIKALSLPLNANNRFFYFSGMVGSILADGSVAFSSQLTSGVYALGAPAGTIVAGTKQFFAMTRTNNAAHSRLELFISPDATSDATLVGFSPEFLAAASQDGAGDLGQICGYGSGSTIVVDDYQVTKNVNRYRGLTSFPVPTAPLPTS